MLWAALKSAFMRDTSTVLVSSMTRRSHSSGRSLTHEPLAVIHSPSITEAACPTTVTRSRLPPSAPSGRRTRCRHCGR